MTQQDFNQEQNPYEYEKPVSANRFRKYGSVATFGLLAFGTAFGGNALAASLTATVSPATTAETITTAETLGAAGAASALAVDSLGSTITSIDLNGGQVPASTQVASVDPTLSPVRALPSATSTKSPIIGLPVLPITDYGNVSSATPSGSSGGSGTSGSKGITTGASWGDDDDDDDDNREDRDDDNDREDNDDD